MYRRTMRVFSFSPFVGLSQLDGFARNETRRRKKRMEKHREGYTGVIFVT